MADQSKKTRTELKSFFVPNAIPTADDFAVLIDSGLNQLDDGLRIEAGKVTVSGAIEAKAGLTVAGAPVTFGVSDAKQPLKVNGSITATDLLTAENGLTVSAGSVSINTSATISGQLAVSGQLNAAANLTLSGTFTAAGGAVTIGDAGTNLAMTVHHTLTVNRETALNKGLTVKGGNVGIGDSNVPQSLTVSGAGNILGGATILNGLSVPTGDVTFGGLVNANAGLWVRGGNLFIGEPSAKQDMYLNGVLNAQEGVNLNKGLSVNNQPISANAGLNVWGGNMIVGSPSINQTLTVNGTVYAYKYLLAAPSGDPSPVITARTMPLNQGGGNEVSELILFHGDDAAPGLGPDYITLRAPAIRLQTYGTIGGASIDNAATSNTRLLIDPNGAVTVAQSLSAGSISTTSGLLTANAGLTVASGNTTLNGVLSVAQTPRTGSHVGSILGAYITGDFTDASGVEIRHTNGSQGIGFGFNTIYATGSIADQFLRLKARGAGSVEILSNLNVTGMLSGPPNDYIKAQFTLMGGGTITWAGGRLKWSNRFLAVSCGNSASTILSGYVNVAMPTTDIPAANVYDGVARSVNAQGLWLKSWEALYAVHTPGQNQDAVSLRIVLYNVNHVVPSNWLLVAVMNNDDGSVKLGTGQTLYDGNQAINPGPFTATGLLSANAGATVTGLATVNGNLSIAQAPRSGTHPGTILGAYITGDFGESQGVEIRHSNGSQGIGLGYNTIYAAGSLTDQPLRLKARGASSVEVQGNLNISGSLSGAPNDYFRAQFALSGGGNVTWAGGRLKWTSRFLAISAGVSAATLPAGHINIYMPATDIPAANVYDGVARSVTAAGLLLKPYEALYAVHTMGQNQDAISFRIVIYSSPHVVPSNWILIAVMNNDDGTSIKLGTGQIIQNANTLTSIGAMTAQAGLSVLAGGINVTGSAILNTGLVVNGGPSWLSTLVTADAGLTVNNGALWSNSLITANNGLNVNVGALWSNSLVTANAGLTVNNGPLWSNTPVTANAGLTVNGTQLVSNTLVQATAGLTVSNAPLVINPGGAQYQLQVMGNAMVMSLAFTPPPSDPIPTISARPVPVSQGGTNESTELILFHGNDGANGAGPDYITLRAPAVRIQTYNDSTVGDINNPAGAQTRFSIDPVGAITASGTLTIPTILFTAPPGDSSPVITARATPPSQGGTNESTELIIFHSNDGLNGAGPDYITLRAPGLRFQTYNDSSVSDINNPNGSQTRMYIDPLGVVNILPGILRMGPNTAVVSGQVTGVFGCLGPGISHGQLAYRAGFGFELVDVSGPGPIVGYSRDALPYTDLRLRQLQYQTQAQFSSRALKEDIRDLSAEQAMDAFEKLQPVTYRFKADSTGRTHAGFIAEDVPELASMDEHKAISPTDILAVLTRIVHLQQESIRRLEAQIAALNPV